MTRYYKMLITCILLAGQFKNSHATTVGPVGGGTTSNFDSTSETSQPISRLDIWFGDVVNTIKISYNRTKYDACGKTTGRSDASFNVSANDPIIKVKGIQGNYFGATHFAQMIFITKSGKQFGPYGSGNFMSDTTKFSLKSPDDEKIQGFFGGCLKHTDDSTFLSSLGISTVDTLTKISKNSTEKKDKTKARKNKKLNR